jgi:hypothetical protein
MQEFQNLPAFQKDTSWYSNHSQLAVVKNIPQVVGARLSLPFSDSIFNLTAGHLRQAGHLCRA